MGGKWLNPFDWKNLLNFTTIGVVVVHDKPSQIQLWNRIEEGGDGKWKIKRL